jgi:hypothetical protein
MPDDLVCASLRDTKFDAQFKFYSERLNQYSASFLLHADRALPFEPVVIIDDTRHAAHRCIIQQCYWHLIGRGG